MRSVARVLWLLVILPLALHAQQREDAVLAGLAVSSDGQPLRRVTLTLSGAALPTSRLAVSDDQGRFSFAELPAGRYTLTAARSGYLTTGYGATRGWRSPGVPIVVASGQRRSDLRIALLKGAVITGRVIDTNGLPVQEVRINIGELRVVDGQVTYTTVAGLDSAPGANATTAASTAYTDDRGIYRFYGLPPGQFLVSAYRVEGDPLRTFELPVGRSASATPAKVGYAPQYFPGTSDPSGAQAIAVSAGEERAGIDFVLQPIPFATVSGTLTGATTGPMPDVTVFATPLGGVAGALRSALLPLGSSDREGRYTVRSVPPGRFALLAIASALVDGRPRSTFGTTEVTVAGSDLTGVDLRMVPGVSVSGRLMIEGTSAALPAELRRTKVRLVASRSSGGPAIVVPPVDVAADGTFSFDGVGPGSYILAVTLPSAAWMLKSARAPGRDLLTQPLDIASEQPINGLAVSVTDRVGEISGVLLDPENQPAPDFYVLAYPVDRRLWTLGRERLMPAVRPDSEGRYRIVGLAPGDYYLAALTDLQPSDYFDPTFLELLPPTSIKITIAEGEKRVQNVRLGR